MSALSAHLFSSVGSSALRVIVSELGSLVFSCIEETMFVVQTSRKFARSVSLKMSGKCSGAGNDFFREVNVGASKGVFLV